MQLKSLQLENFRNYDHLFLDFEENEVTALVGQNAQGKTNVLESIAFLALGKSFRARKALETLGWDRPHGRIRGTVLSNEEGSKSPKETELEVFFQRQPQTKKVKLQSKVTTPSDFLGHLQVVLFTPEHLHLVSGGPKLRRQYLDRTLVQLNRKYLEALTTYHQVLKQRNALLKRIQQNQAQGWELDLWDARLITEAQVIWQGRELLVNFLKSRLQDLYQTLSATQEYFTLDYHSHQDRYEERLAAHREMDIRTGSSSQGPHRDDFNLKLEGRPIADFGSRGECRSAVLALKVAEIHYMEQETGHKPLLLLDDVFSELDESRQIHLGELLKGCQTLITTTAMEHVKGLKGAKVYKVEEGAVSPT